MEDTIVDCLTAKVRRVPAEPMPPLVPAMVSMRQARLALLGEGLLDKVDQALASMPAAQRDAAQIEWEYSTEVRRDSALVAALGALLSLDEGQVDGLFVKAGGL